MDSKHEQVTPHTTKSDKEKTQPMIKTSTSHAPLTISQHRADGSHAAQIIPFAPEYAATPKAHPKTLKTPAQPQLEASDIRDDTDNTIARLFIRHYGDNHRYVTDAGHWIHWNGDAWHNVSKAQAVHDDLRNLRQLIAGQRSTHLQTVVDSVIKKLSNDGSKNSVIHYLEHESALAVLGCQVDASDSIVAFQNAACDLSSGKIIRGKKDLRALLHTRRMSVLYDKKAACPRWKEFLDSVFCGDKELISYVQKAVALSLSGEVSEEYLFFAHGKGANGKTTFFETLRRIFGDYHLELDASVLTKSRLDNNGVNMQFKARLKGIRFATTNEIADQSEFNDLEVKRLSSRDQITARKLYHEPCEFAPSHKLWVRSNHKPRFNVTDNALLRRIVLIPFNRYFSEKERVNRYEDVLLAEKSGILNWLLQGWNMYQKEGLALPAVCRKEMEKYVGECDYVARFLSECCLEGCSDKIMLKELRLQYNAWADRNDCPLLTSGELSARLKAKNIMVCNGKANQLYVHGYRFAAGG